MAVMEMWRRRDLEGTVKPEYIDGNFFTQDSAGNLVGVKCYKDGAEATLSGSVTGYCILTNGETVSVAGTRSGNKASILIPQSALAYTGPLGVVIKLIDGNTITTLLSIIVVVYRSKTDTVITPSSQIITDWSNQIAAALQDVEDASAAQDAKIDDLNGALELDVDFLQTQRDDTFDDLFDTKSTGISRITDSDVQNKIYGYNNGSWGEISKNTWHYCKFTVEPNTRYKITCTALYPKAPGYIFLDSSDNIIGHSLLGSATEDTRVDISEEFYTPTGCVTLIVNKIYLAAMPTLFKIEYKCKLYGFDPDALTTYVRSKIELKAWNGTSGWYSSNTRMSCTTPISLPFPVKIDVYGIQNINTITIYKFSSSTATPANLVDTDSIAINKNTSITLPANTFWCFALSKVNNADFDADEKASIKLSYYPFVDKSLSYGEEAADAKIVGDQLKIVGDQFDIFDSAALTTKIQNGMALKGWNSTYGFTNNTKRMSYTTPIYSRVPLYLDVTGIEYVYAVQIYVFSGNAATVDNYVSYSTVTLSGKQVVILPANTYFCFVISKASQREFSLTEASSVKLSYYPLVDNTLLISGEAADAKKTGEKIQEIAEMLGQSSGTWLPDHYFVNDYIQNKCATILSNSCVTSGETFAFITDMHLIANKKISAYLLNYLMKNAGLHFVVSGGDVNTAHSTEYGQEEEETIAEANAWIDYVGIVGKERFFQCRGNHDHNKGSASGLTPYLRYGMPDKDVYTYVARLNEGAVETHPNRNYYCIDNASQKVRIFVLDEYKTESNGSISIYLDPEQYNWVIAKIQDVTGWSFVFVSHQSFDSEITYYDETYEPYQNLFKAMVNGTRFQYTNAELGISTDIDFSDYQNTFVCHISGHNHKDEYHVDDNVLSISTSCDAFYAYDDPSTNRVANSVTEQLFDVFSIDTTAKTIKACRIGGGSDRNWNYAVT